MHDETGGLIGGILVMRDISEEMRFKATQTYLEEKIFHVQKMEALGQLAGGIAHDFNNLLTAIIGNIALLKYHVIPDQQKLVSATEQACSRAAELVKQLLSFGRTDHETDKPVNIAPIIEEVVGVVKAASNQPIMIETRISEKVPAISGNSSQLYQVIMNLCMNARDAVFDARDIQGFNNDNNRTDIVITLEKRSTPQHLRATLGVDATEIVELRITDFGTGMSHETKRKIFEPFFTTKPVGKGTGLGLATVYGIVRRFGGAIELETNLGEGTTFRILLPAADELTSNSPSFSTLGASLRGSGLLLIADRDPLVRDIIGAMFGELGYEILCAGSDEELYRQLSDHSKRIRAILTNAELSDESGDGLIKNIRSRTPDTPLILITNHPIPALDSPKLTKVSVVQKPYKLHDLAREIASVTTAKVTNIKRMEQI
jgi:signal transduction histidine kinase/CheY-like chemotaxis protein